MNSVATTIAMQPVCNAAGQRTHFARTKINRMIDSNSYRSLGTILQFLFKDVADDPILTNLSISMWEDVPEFYKEFCPGNFSMYTRYLRLILSKWPQFEVGAPTSSTLVFYIHHTYPSLLHTYTSGKKVLCIKNCQSSFYQTCRALQQVS